ncbi:MAG: hypothetical protein ACYDEP_07850 [Acidimicrobiales bacterium]
MTFAFRFGHQCSPDHFDAVTPSEKGVFFDQDVCGVTVFADRTPEATVIA